MPTTVTESDVLNDWEFAEALRISRIPMFQVAEKTGISRAKLSAFKNGRGILKDDELQAIVDFFEANDITFNANGDDDDADDDPMNDAHVQSCSTCRHRNGEGEQFECRAHPPLMIPINTQTLGGPRMGLTPAVPVVTAAYWCGEWRADVGAKLELLS